MLRIPRVVVPGVAHHVTQRGNNRRQVFFSAQDHRLYLRLLSGYCLEYELALWGYCLMPNHVHLIVVPRRLNSMASALGRTHADFARIANINAETTGHFWQSRYFSCPLDDHHRWLALAYVERNPVRAGLVVEPAAYDWSSARAHLGGPDPTGILDTHVWRGIYDAEAWRRQLVQLTDDQALQLRIRESSHAGRPLGNSQSVAALEVAQDRPLRALRRGRRSQAHHA